MFEQIETQQAKLIQLIERYTDKDGAYTTAIPFLYFSRFSNVTGPNYGVYKPSLCIIVQGEKEVFLSQERYVYNPTSYLVASVNLPIAGMVTKASSQYPYLALIIEFKPNQILEVLQSTHFNVSQKEHTKRGLYVSQIEPSLLDAVTRLAQLLDQPADIPVLAPLIITEIIYRVLQGKYGVTLGQIGLKGSSTHLINGVIEYIMEHYNQSFRIEDLADIANMGVSSLHRHFKEVTAMTPIQFQKRLRLQEARRLLLANSMDATEAAFQVGYESPSQFSREYSRMFGLPPKEDIKRLKKVYA